MAIKKITLTEEHLKLISSFYILKIDDDNVGIDINDLFGGEFAVEDIATILGWLDKAIPNTKEDADGRAFPDEVEAEMLRLYTYICIHLHDIEILVHQFVMNGGLSVGTYKCRDNDLIWHKAED